LKLYYSTTSPYARKVRIVAIEKGLADRIELVTANPWTDPAAVLAANPLGKVPALVSDEGLALYDSPVICEYLDTLAEEPRLIPASGNARWRVLCTQALADGVLDAAVSVVLDRRRPEAERSIVLQERAGEAIRRSVQVLAANLGAAHGSLDLGQLATAVAFDYLQFRLPEMDFGAGHAAVRHWCAEVGRRTSFTATVPI